MIRFICGRAGSGKTTRVCSLAAKSVSRLKRTYMIVPEQQAVDAEKLMTGLIGEASSLCLEILNFKRLCNRVFREYGGLSYSGVTDSGRALLMWKALRETSPSLTEYSQENGARRDDTSLIEAMLRTISELRANRVTPAALERSAGKLLKMSKDTRCNGKISDPEQPSCDEQSTVADQNQAENPTPYTASGNGNKPISEVSSDASERFSARSEKLAAKLSDLSLIFAEYSALLSEVSDDAVDDLDRAAELLRENRFFAGADVFLDSFNGFTEQEFALIYEMMRQAENVTLSLAIGTKGDAADAGAPFENIAETFMKLKRLAKSAGQEITVEPLSENHRASSPELAFLEKNLWSLDVQHDGAFISEPDENRLRVVECQDLLSECSAVAADILKKVRAGARWRDFAVVTRGTDRYDGIVDVILEKYGVPFFFSKRSDITSKPLIRLIFSAFSIYSGGFRPVDMIAYLKTGLAGIDPDESADFEGYIERWSIRGEARWTSVWTMDPRGYGFSDMPDQVRTLLDEINELRETVIVPLSKFFSTLDLCRGVAEYAAALYNFLLELNVPEQLEERAAELKAEETSSADAESDETARIFDVVIDSLDELVSVIGDLETDAETFIKLLSICLGAADIGRIPAAVDEVVIGDASLLRASRRNVYLIGANEGIFPAAPDDGGLLGDSDRELLKSTGTELADSEYRAADERFHFYRALTSASDSVTVLFADAELSGKPLRPSQGVKRLFALFPKLKTIRYSDAPLSVRLEGKNCLLGFAAEAGKTPLGGALRDILKSSPETEEKLSALDIPLSESGITLEKETAESVFDGDLSLTQSRLDSFVLCHFSFFCKYILKLEDSRPAEFDAANIGSFIHEILEKFVSGATERGSLSSMTDKEIADMVDDIVESCMAEISRSLPDIKGSRLGHLFTKLRRSSKLLCRNIADEFADCGFSPAFFELPIGFSNGKSSSVAPLEVDLGDGSTAFICGIADRVDLLTRGDKLYVRVVDYKTGTKEFSMDDIAMGLNLQMLLYLFSIWKNGGERGGALVKPSRGKEILPAGVLYFSANVPTVTLDRETSPAEVEAMIRDKLSRRGLLLDDMNVLTAMEHELAGKFLPIKLKKDGSFGKTDALRSLEDFGSLLNEVESTVRQIAVEIKRGNAGARPLKTKRHDACRYCRMKPVCRIKR